MRPSCDATNAGGGAHQNNSLAGRCPTVAALHAALQTAAAASAAYLGKVAAQRAWPGLWHQANESASAESGRRSNQPLQMAWFTAPDTKWTTASTAARAAKALIPAIQLPQQQRDQIQVANIGVRWGASAAAAATADGGSAHPSAMDCSASIVVEDAAVRSRCRPFALWQASAASERGP